MDMVRYHPNMPPSRTATITGRVSIRLDSFSLPFNIPLVVVAKYRHMCLLCGIRVTIRPF